MYSTYLRPLLEHKVAWSGRQDHVVSRLREELHAVLARGELKVVVPDGVGQREMQHAERQPSPDAVVRTYTQ